MKITQFKKVYKDTFPVGEGWRELVEQLVDNILLLDREVEITQVKEKFGGLRFYIGVAGKLVHDLIDDAEKESFKICEQCGTRENVSTKGTWVLTLCVKCRKENKI